MTQETMTLHISGMTCDGCAASVYNALNEIVGVIHVEVNLSLEQAVIDYDDSQVDKIELIQAVEDAGFSTTK